MSPVRVRVDEPRPLRVIDLTEFYSLRGRVRCHLDTKGDALTRLGHEHWVVAPGPDENRQCGLSHTGPRVVRLGGPALPYDSNYRGESAPSTGRVADRVRWYWDQRMISGGEAEFSGLSTAEAAVRLDGGARVLARAGLRIDGFVAPAWCLPDRVMPLLAERGIRYTEDRTHTYDPVARRRRLSAVLNFASRSRIRSLTTVAYCRAVRNAGRFVPVRIAIHPGDLRVPLLRGELRRLLEWAARFTA